MDNEDWSRFKEQLAEAYLSDEPFDELTKLFDRWDIDIESYRIFKEIGSKYRPKL